MAKPNSGRNKSRQAENEKHDSSSARGCSSERFGDHSALWKRFWSGNDDAFDELFETYREVAKVIARAHKGRGIGLPELLDVAEQGLRAAIFECNPQRSCEFRAFACDIIRNHVVDRIREVSHRTRHEQEQDARFQAAHGTLSHRFGRRPSDEEVYAALKWSHVQQRNHQASIAKRFGSSLEQIAEMTGDLPHDDSMSRPDETLLQCEQRSRLPSSLDQLDTLSQRVIIERFFANPRRSQKDTATHLGITEYREREIERTALNRMKELIEGRDGNSGTS